MTTGTSNGTLWFEHGEQVYPCRCGETHRGDYAAYEWGHHNCLHEAPLWQIVDDHYICAACGADFFLRGDDV